MKYGKHLVQVAIWITNGTEDDEATFGRALTLAEEKNFRKCKDFIGAWTMTMKQVAYGLAARGVHEIMNRMIEAEMPRRRILG